MARNLILRSALMALLFSALPLAGVVAEEGSKLFWFSVQEEYRGRFATAYQTPYLYSESESDHDARLFVVGGARDHADRFRGQLSLGAWFDMDGTPTAGEPAAFGSMWDTDHLVWFDVFSLYGEYHSDTWLKNIRLGRQVTEHGIAATFDGLSLELSALGPIVEFFVFGGRSTHFFEQNADLFEDWLASAGATIRPFPELKLELDYRFLMEETALTDGIQDHTYGASAWYNPIDWLYVKAYGRGFADAFSHTGGALRMAWYKIGLGLDLKADSQLVTLREVNEWENPFYAILGDSLPHTRWAADVWKSFDTKAGNYSLHLGWNGRANHDEEGLFNRDYARLYFLFEARDIGTKGPFASLVVENHSTGLAPTFDEEGFLTAGGALGFNHALFRAEAGTYYQRFKYDYYHDVREYENVRTFYGSFRINPLSWLAVRVRYNYEQLDRDIHTVFLTLTQTY